MYKIKIEVNGVIIDEFTSNGKNTILQDAIYNNVDLDYSCQEGLCEVCLCHYEGVVDTPSDDKILTCITRAKSNLILKY